MEMNQWIDSVIIFDLTGDDHFGYNLEADIHYTTYFEI